MKYKLYQINNLNEKTKVWREEKLFCIKKWNEMGRKKMARRRKNETAKLDY